MTDFKNLFSATAYIRPINFACSELRINYEQENDQWSEYKSRIFSGQNFQTHETSIASLVYSISSLETTIIALDGLAL